MKLHLIEIQRGKFSLESNLFGGQSVSATRIQALLRSKSFWEQSVTQASLICTLKSDFEGQLSSKGQLWQILKAFHLPDRIPNSESRSVICRWAIWLYGLWSFQMGDAKLERVLPKNQHTQMKLLNFEFWINGKLSKSAKIWLSKSIFSVKNHPNLSHFFHWKIPI